MSPIKKIRLRPTVQVIRGDGFVTFQRGFHLFEVTGKKSVLLCDRLLLGLQNGAFDEASAHGKSIGSSVATRILDGLTETGMLEIISSDSSQSPDRSRTYSGPLSQNLNLIDDKSGGTLGSLEDLEDVRVIYIGTREFGKKLHDALTVLGFQARISIYPGELMPISRAGHAPREKLDKLRFCDERAVLIEPDGRTVSTSGCLYKSNIDLFDIVVVEDFRRVGDYGDTLCRVMRFVDVEKHANTKLIPIWSTAGAIVVGPLIHGVDSCPECLKLCMETNRTALVPAMSKESASVSLALAVVSRLIFRTQLGVVGHSQGAELTEILVDRLAIRLHRMARNPACPACGRVKDLILGTSIENYLDAGEVDSEAGQEARTDGVTRATLSNAVGPFSPVARIDALDLMQLPHHQCAAQLNGQSHWYIEVGSSFEDAKSGAIVTAYQRYIEAALCHKQSCLVDPGNQKNGDIARVRHLRSRQSYFSVCSATDRLRLLANCFGVLIAKWSIKHGAWNGAAEREISEDDCDRTCLYLKDAQINWHFDSCKLEVSAGSIYICRFRDADEVVSIIAGSTIADVVSWGARDVWLHASARHSKRLSPNDVAGYPRFRAAKFAIPDASMYFSVLHDITGLNFVFSPIPWELDLPSRRTSFACAWLE